MKNQQINPPAYMWDRIEQALDRQDALAKTSNDKAYWDFYIKMSLKKRPVIFTACAIFIVSLLAFTK